MQKDDVARIAAKVRLAEIDMLILRSMHIDFKHRYTLTENRDENN